MSAPLDTALAFVAAINNADLTTLRVLMTGDHTFTDALAHSFSGAETMLSGWQHYFHAYPNYRITITQTFADENKVVLIGKAEGGWRVGETVLQQTWSVPAAWLAEISDGKVRHWTVFCDTGWATPPK
jgi:SnoaL-like domain